MSELANSERTSETGAASAKTDARRPYRAPSITKRERLSAITAEDSKAASGVTIT